MPQGLVPHQCTLCLPRSRKSISHYGSCEWRRFEVPSHQKFEIYRRADEYLSRKLEFFACSIILGLEFLHNKGIIHRDLKPENIVFDKKGYLRITDLGVARIWKPENSNDTSGTPGYMAPEVMCRCNHGVAVDYYALGIIVF